MDIYEYCDDLGSISPTPGGGSAAGYVLSLAASCIEKSIRFSIKEGNDFLNNVIVIKKTGFDLSNQDQVAFKNWSNARKLPKDSNDEKKIRNEKMNLYINECVLVPLNICKNSFFLLNLINDFFPKCNNYLISDVAVGTSFTFSAFESGVFNIITNLTFIKNDELKKELTEYIKNNKNEFTIKKNNILKYCEDKISEDKKK